MAGYPIRGGKEGKERLNLLARVMLPTTSQLLNAVGINSGMRCLDVGCGGGHVTLLMAGLVELEDKVVGTDMDGEVIALARKDARTAKLDNVEFRRADAAMCQATGKYDLVYARFLLSHLSEPERCLEAMVGGCNVKGAIVLEDIDSLAAFPTQLAPPMTGTHNCIRISSIDAVAMQISAPNCRACCAKWAQRTFW
jgi:2-polyprenyl-3-methyl-5-hydroxy-6-metoxy-1,4-benzoquinol methylase